MHGSNSFDDMEQHWNLEASLERGRTLYRRQQDEVLRELCVFRQGTSSLLHRSPIGPPEGGDGRRVFAVTGTIK